MELNKITRKNILLSKGVAGIKVKHLLFIKGKEKKKFLLKLMQSE